MKLWWWKWQWWRLQLFWAKLSDGEKATLGLVALLIPILLSILLWPWLIIVWGWIGFTTAMFLIIYGMIRRD